MTYHHGDLRRALLRAAAEAITETGVATLSMRDLARRAGVSHAAPAHHFGDRAGLLTAFATEGFDLLAKALATSRLASNSFLELGVTYVRFAVTRRAQFEVMFRTDLYHADDPAVLAARRRAADALYSAVADLPDGTLAPGAPAPQEPAVPGAATLAPVTARPAPAPAPAARPAPACRPAAAPAPAPAADRPAGASSSAADRLAGASGLAADRLAGASGSAADRPAAATARPAVARPGPEGQAARGVASTADRTARVGRPVAARPAREGAADAATPDVRVAGLAAWSMAHGFATLWLSGAFPDRDADPAEVARTIFAELNRDAAVSA